MSGLENTFVLLTKYAYPADSNDCSDGVRGGVAAVCAAEFFGGNDAIGIDQRVVLHVSLSRTGVITPSYKF
jgi:hypothetical protein